MSRSRTPFEFEPKTKKEALEEYDYKCALTGAPDEDENWLQINHTVAIWFAREMGIEPALIKSLANAMPVESEAHRRYHEQENRHQYAYLAWHLLGVDVEPKNEKDTWRKDPNHPINKYRKKKKRR